MKERMRELVVAVGKMFLGFTLFAIGSVIIINCKIGVSPWDVLHQGMANVGGFGVGRAMIYSGIVIVTLAAILGQSLGWATLLNMYFIGQIVDILMFNNLMPSFENLGLKLVMIIVGIIFQGLGTYFYICTGYGAGPRDGLMVALTKKTGRPFGLVKSCLEVCAVGSGYLLGGNFGIGTLIMAFGAGHIWQYMYKKMGFNISDVDHRFIEDDIRYIREKYKEKDKSNP